MRTGLGRVAALASLALSWACGPQEAWATDGAGADATREELRVSPGNRLVHWQINSDWTEATGTYFRPTNVFRRAAQYTLGPDLWAVQQCGRACACGSAQNYDEATAKCLSPPPPGTLVAEAESILGMRLGYAVSTWANTVLWRRDRFGKPDVLQWNATDADPTYSACARPSDRNGNEAMNIAVRLRDNRGTPDDASDDTTVVLASMHVGNVPGCTVKLWRYFDAEVRARWGPVGYVFVSGDLNMRVDTTSSTEAARRAELRPNCWYGLFTPADAPSSCGADFGGYLDVVATKFPGGAPYSDTRPICSQWTFVSPGDYLSPNDDRCDSTRAHQRIDYTFLGGARADPSRLLRAAVDQGYYDANGNGDVDTGEKYAGHRAVRTVVGW